MYCVSFQSKLWRNALIQGKRLVRSHSDYIKRTFHAKTIVLQQSHQLSPKQIELINLKEVENPNSKSERIAIVLPISTTTTNPDNVFHSEPKRISKTNKTEESKWTVTPSEDISKLGKHYLMLSKSRLTCTERKSFIILRCCKIEFFFSFSLKRSS